MKRRLLALAAGFAVLGSFAVGGAMSLPDYTDTATHTVGVDVADPSPPDLYFSTILTEIPADGDFYAVDDIRSNDGDGNYDYTLVELEVTSQGHGNGSCGGSSNWLYALDNSGSQDITPGTALGDGDTDTGEDLFIKILSSVSSESCIVSEGVVTATYQVTA